MNLRNFASLPDRTFLFTSDLDVQRLQVFIQRIHANGAWNEDNVVALSHQPPHCQLTGCASLLLRDIVDLINKLEILEEVLLAESWRYPTEVVIIEIDRQADMVGYQTTTN